MFDGQGGWQPRCPHGVEVWPGVRALQDQYAAPADGAPDGKYQAVADGHLIAAILKNPPSMCSVGKKTYSMSAAHITTHTAPRMMILTADLIIRPTLRMR